MWSIIDKNLDNCQGRGVKSFTKDIDRRRDAPMKQEGGMKAWHFLQDDGRLQWRCGRTWKPRVGQTLRVAPPLIMCQHGLHASVNALHALSYAPMTRELIACRVEMGGEIINWVDKICAEWRKILWKADATKTLHLFNIWCAERALKQNNVTDARCWDVLDAKRKWLKGEIDDRQLAVAARAAWAARAAGAEWAAWAAWAAGAAGAEWAEWAAGAARAARAARAAGIAGAAGAAGAAEAAEFKVQNRKLTRMLNGLRP